MSEHVITLDGGNFDSKTAKGSWIVDFWAEWCGPCKILSPTVDQVAGEMKGKINFAKVDVDGEQDLAQMFDVMSIPTLLFIKDGQVVDRTVGAISKQTLINKAQELL